MTELADPIFIVVAWAAGLAFAGGFVALSRLVGPGFTWLIAGTTAVMSLASALREDAWWARVGLVAVVLGLLWARNKDLSGAMMLVGGMALLVDASSYGGWVAAPIGAVALGGVTGEMMLGHWYLVDPRLPRWSLKALALAAIAGLGLTGVHFALTATVTGGAVAVFWVLLVTSIVLMAAVLAALAYPAYSGVMAATGLSYLAVLTSLGAVFLGRALEVGFGPFS